MIPEPIIPVDGVLAQFGPRYTSVAGPDDAEKLYNYDENLSLKRGDAYLSIERRAVAQKTDTLFLHVAAFKKGSNYAFSIKPSGFPAAQVSAYVLDNYLHTETAVSLSRITEYAFTVTTDAGSYAPERFSIVFTKSTATKKEGQDVIAQQGFGIYPNPVAGRKVTLQLNTVQAGNYNLLMFDKRGTQVMNRKISLDGFTTAQSIELPYNIVAGSYQVVLANDNGNQFKQQLIIQ